MQKRGELKQGFLVVALVLLAAAYLSYSLQSGSGFVVRGPVRQQTSTYISFMEPTATTYHMARYAVVDANLNVQLNTIYTNPIPYGVVTKPKMAKDSGQVHFLFATSNSFFDPTSLRILYKPETRLSSPPETIPFPYGTGGLLSFTGFLPQDSDIAIGPGDTPYVVSHGRTYSQGQIVSNQIMITKKLSTGWTQAVTLYQPPIITPTTDVALTFDEDLNGHVFYQVFTNPTCLGINCPRSLYELVFSTATLVVLSNNLIITFNGSFPEANFIQPLLNLESDSGDSIVYIKTTTNSNPYNFYVDFASSINGWTPQTLVTSIVLQAQHYSTSGSLASAPNSKGDISLGASEKNVQTGIAKLLLFTSPNYGLSWSSTVLLSSSASQYRDVNIGIRGLGKNKETDIAYTEAISVGTLSSEIFNKLQFIRINKQGTNSLLIYQNPSGYDLSIGDLLVF